MPFVTCWASAKIVVLASDMVPRRWAAKTGVVGMLDAKKRQLDTQKNRCLLRCGACQKQGEVSVKNNAPVPDRSISTLRSQQFIKKVRSTVRFTGSGSTIYIGNMDWRSDYFETAVGPKPRSKSTLRALSSNQGDQFFTEIDNGFSVALRDGESYREWLARKPELTTKQIFLLNAGVPSSVIGPVAAYVQSFLSLPCSPLVVRSVANGLRFVQEKSVPGSCGEGGCQNSIKATAAHDILAMIERTSEASSGAIVVALTPKKVFTEWQGIIDVARSEKSRIGVVSTSRVGSSNVRDAARLVLRAVLTLIGFVPCVWMKCVLNELATHATDSMDLACPACLRRIASLHDVTKDFNYFQRYELLYDWYMIHQECNLGELEWLRERYYAITGREIAGVGGGGGDGSGSGCNSGGGSGSGCDGGGDGGGGGGGGGRSSAPSGSSTLTESKSNGGEDLSAEEIRSKLSLLKIRRRKQ